MATHHFYLFARAVLTMCLAGLAASAAVRLHNYGLSVQVFDNRISVEGYESNLKAIAGKFGEYDKFIAETKKGEK